MENCLLTNETSERLNFRRLMDMDFNDWMDFCEEPTSLEYLWLTESTDPRINCEAWFEKVYFRYDNNLGGMNVLTDKITNEFIGQCGLLRQIVDGKEELEIGYSILPKHRNNGYAFEAAQKCRDFAFENSLAEDIISIIHPDNIASQKVALKNGMQKEKETIYHGQNAFIYRVDKKDWLRNIIS